MKTKLLIITLLIFNCKLFSQTITYINITPHVDSTMIIVGVGFPLGSGTFCPEILSIQVNQINDTLELNIIYDTSGPWHAFFCFRRDTLYLNVQPGTDYTLWLNTYSNNGVNTTFGSDTIVTFSSPPIGVKEQHELKSFTFHPNPTSSLLTISMAHQTSENMLFTFYNSVGQIVKELQIMNYKLQEINIDMDDLPDGLYFLTVRGQGFTINEKIIKI